MSNPYTSQSISGYNSNPPPDDASQTSANEITWSKHKTKLSDPVKTLAEGVDSAVSSAFGSIFGNDITSQGSNYTVQTSDQGKVVNVTASATITLPAAGTAGQNFTVSVINTSLVNIVIDGDSTETINGLQTLILGPADHAILSTDGSAWFAQLSRSKFSSGLVPSNDTDTDHDIQISTGFAGLLGLSSVITKQIDNVWVEGDDAGGYPSGLSPVPMTDTWHHVFLVDTSSGTIDAGFDTSASATNLLSDTGGSLYWHVGWVLTDSSGNILAFKARETEGGGLYSRWDVPADDVDSTNPGTSPVTPTISVPPDTLAITDWEFGDSSAASASKLIVTETSQTATAPGGSAFTFNVTVDSERSGGRLQLWADASSQIRYELDASTGDHAVKVFTVAWVDPRR